MKQHIAIIFTITLLAAVIIACAQAPTTPVVNEQPPIKIGATLPLSGSLAYIGEADLNGLQMAVDDINAAGGVDGRKLVLIVDDNKGDAKEAVTNANRLINAEKSDVFISAFTHITSAVKSVAYDSKTIMFYSSTVSDFARENDYTFKDHVDMIEEGSVIANAIHKAGYTKIAVISENSDACAVFVNGVANTSSALGFKIVHKELFNSNEIDMKTQLLKIKESSPDAIVACTWRHEPIFMKQLQEMNMLDIPTFHHFAPFLPAADTPEINALLEKNKAVSAWYGALAEGSALQQDFAKRYKERYNNTPRPDAQFLYDDVQLYVRALKLCNADPANKDCIIKNLVEIQYDGVGGKLYFDKDGASSRDVILITRKDNAWVEYK